MKKLLYIMMVAGFAAGLAAWCLARSLLGA